MSDFRHHPQFRRGVMKRALLCSVLAGFLGASLAVAAPGSIPIYQQTVITNPGHYVVTRDFEVATGSAIDIQADHVELDLNGHTITSTSVTDPVISIDPADFVRIKNGQLIGGRFGVHSWSTSGLTMWMERIVFSQSSEMSLDFLSALHVEVVSCTFVQPGGNAISALPPPGGEPMSGLFVDNSIIEAGNYGIYLGKSRGVVIEGNDISGVASGCIVLGHRFGGGGIIENNSCSRKANGVYPADGIELESDNNQVLGNTVRGFSDGIRVSGNGNRIAENVVADSVIFDVHPGAGIYVRGGVAGDAVHNLIEGNHIEDNAGCGILLETTAVETVYRNNTLRGNVGGAVCDSGTGNTDAGGNVP
jgi:parallel beta-helix repeat protein